VVVVGKSNHQIDVAENCVELTNQTSLLQLIRLIRGARFVISVDSGPMHIAAAVNDKLLSIHTWTNPRRVGPYNPDAWVWKHGKVLKVSELENAKLKRHGRPLKSKDIPAIVEFVRPLVPIDPMLA
jgi:ADP-heptose:LPS heptosyltransferase